MIFETESLIAKAAAILQAGGVVIVPTETFYALAADPFQDQAVKRIFRIKSRPENMPLPMICSQRAVVDEMSHGMCALTKALMDNFWPGSLTILLESNVNLSHLVRGPTGKIGVRIPPDCPARRLAELTDGWITATSANLTGGPSPNKFTDIAESVIDAVDLALDMGRTPGGKPSTVVEPLEDGVRFVREGAVSRNVIMKTVGDFLRGKSSLTG